MPDVSVITTAYNASRYIRGAIESVLAQRGVAVEHVIVDDGSTDGTASVAEASGDARVRVIREGRVGRGRALNRALEACQTDWIAVLDADDLSHPDRLRVEADALAAHPEASLAGSGQILIETDHVAVEWPDASDVSFSPVNAALPIYNPLSHSSVMFRRSALLAAGGYDADRRALFDWDLYIRIAARGGLLLKASVPLAAKRIHREQFFEGSGRMQYVAACFRLQWRSLGELRRSRLLAGLFPLLAAYRMTPRPMRMAARKVVSAIKDQSR